MSTEFIKTASNRIPGPWISWTRKLKKQYLHIFSPLETKNFVRRFFRRKQSAQSFQETQGASRKGNVGEVEFREQFRTGVLCQVNNRGNVKE